MPEKIIGTMITGASDDLIEIEGELREEFSAYNCESDDGRIACSDGTLLKVEYDENGIWRFTALVKGSLYNRKVEGDIEADTFDEVYFKPGLKWIAFAKNMQTEVIRKAEGKPCGG